MGADIHAVLEKYHPEFGWVGVHDFPYISIDNVNVSSPAWPDDSKTRQEWYDRTYMSWKVLDRNYHLFAMLAGVRGAGPDPKGVPDDASDLAKMGIASWGRDGHSHSYGLLSEVGAIFLLSSGDPTEILSETRIKSILDLFGLDYSESLDEYRLIFWFDN